MSKSDSRAISKEFISDLLDKNNILNYILEKYIKDATKDLILCFRGNGKEEKIILYRNNHVFWQIKKQSESYRLELNFDHAKFSKDFWNTLGVLQKIKIGSKIDVNKTKTNTLGTQRRFGYIGGRIDNFKYEDIDKLYDCTNTVLNDYFNQDKKTNYFLIEGIDKSKKIYLEKIIQQKIFQSLDRPCDGNGYLIYDLEFTPPKADVDSDEGAKNKNKPDFFAVRYENNALRGLVVGEIKSTRDAMNGNSGLIDHLTKMKKDIKKYNSNSIRRKETIDILKEYAILGYRGLDDDIDTNIELNFDEILIVLTDDAIKAYTDSKADKEGHTYEETINQFKKTNKDINVVVKKFVDSKLEDI